MASVKQVAVKKKTSDVTPKITQGSLSNQEKKDLEKKIKNLEAENKGLSLENVQLKNNFDLKKILNVLSQKVVKELTPIEMAQDMIKMALQEADKEHSAEKKDMEKKHEEEIETLSQKLQGADQQPTQSKNLDTISISVNTADIHIRLRETTKEIEEANRAKEALEARKQKLESQRLHNEIKEQKRSYEKSKDLMENARKALEAEKQKLEAEVQKLKNENKEQKHSYDKSKYLIEKNQDTISKPVNPNDMHVLLRETTKEKDDAKSENKALLEEKQKLEADIEKDALLADKREWDEEIKRLQDEIKALKQSKENNKGLNEKLRKLEEAKDNLNKQVEALQKENNEVKYRLKVSQIPSLSNVLLANDDKTVQQLRVENERLLSKLRELTSTQPTFNNPSIADLSDAFRPKKLSERYSQLYDNMWTDAFEEHSGKKEEDIIQMLRKRLLGCYEFCENVCREFTVQLTNSTLALPNSKPKNVDIPIGYKNQLQEIKKNFGVFLRNDVKESYRKQNAIEGGDKTKNYIDACVELCWLMVIQDPPVVLETPAPKDSTFDTNTYMTYTTTGTKVDFVVWPALRLHHGGPLLSKGVAQGKK